MKKIVLIGAAAMITILSFGQPDFPSPIPVVVSIPSVPIGICTGKTTNLIFKYDIISVDRGAQNLLVQKVKNAENILQIKAASKDFSETNLSVVTADKRLHSFTIRYDTAPQILNYQLINDWPDSSYSPGGNPPFLKDDLTAAEIQNYAALVGDFEPSFTPVKDKRFGIELQSGGIFIKKNVFFFSLQLRNETPVRYDIESFNMVIKDHRQHKKTATQEIIVQPLFTYGNASVVESFADQHLVIAVSKFTIPDKKDFIIQFREAGGGRHLSIRIRNKKLIKALPL